MGKQPGMATAANEILTVLSLSPLEEDHSSLEGILGHTRWTLLKADRLPTAWAFLQKYDISVVVSERDLMPGTWIDMLKHLQPMPHPPSLIVSSRLADEHLWSEALNLGAWDVLPKPFDRSEVLRSVKAGWQHWHNQIRIPAMTMKMMSAAG